MVTQATRNADQPTIVTVTRRVSVPTHKVCARCHRDLPISEYYGKTPGSYCKTCSNELHKQQRQRQARELAEFREWKATQATAK